MEDSICVTVVPDIAPAQDARRRRRVGGSAGLGGSRHGSGPPRLLPALSAVLGGWAALGISATLWAFVSIKGMHQPFHVGSRDLRFFDLRVYRGAAQRMLDSGDLYRHPIIHRLGFTYPPAAALLLAPLALAPLLADKVAVSALNLLALVWILTSALRLAGVRARRRHVLSVAALCAAGALWWEPVSVSLGYGQIDLLIVGLILFDLSRGEQAPGAGLALGVAAGLKLTPLLFILYLALAGHRRMGLRAAGAFLATIAVSFLSVGGAATRYWGGLILDSARVGGVGDVANQSLRGALARLTDTPHPGPGVELIVALIALGGLAVAVAAARGGRPRLGLGLCAVTTLLASPISWTHHWTLALPMLVVGAVCAWRERDLGLGTLSILGLALGFSYLPELVMPLHGTVTGAGSLAGDPYVLFGLLVLAAGAAAQLRRPWGRRSAPGLPASG